MTARSLTAAPRHAPPFDMGNWARHRAVLAGAGAGRYDYQRCPARAQERSAASLITERHLTLTQIEGGVPRKRQIRRVLEKDAKGM